MADGAAGREVSESNVDRHCLMHPVVRCKGGVVRRDFGGLAAAMPLLGGCLAGKLLRRVTPYAVSDDPMGCVESTAGKLIRALANLLR